MQQLEGLMRMLKVIFALNGPYTNLNYYFVLYYQLKGILKKKAENITIYWYLLVTTFVLGVISLVYLRFTENEYILLLILYIS